mmetsp:Transcript_19756/g.37158  ORF Transcript_19756/g.37158 Transcript_19756/m.37158 type:complete len:328 (-) Transcript_19756:66-1049(-)
MEDLSPLGIKRPAWSKRKGALFALGAGIAAIASVAYRTTNEYSDRFDPATLSVGSLLRMFMDTREYLDDAGWVEEDGTFAPLNSGRLGAVKKSSLASVTRYFSRTSKQNSCGAGIRDVMHVDVLLPGVDSVYVMEALSNPDYRHWNPSLHEVTFRRHRRIPLEANLRDFFSSEEMQVKGGYHSLATEMRDNIDVAAQVAEMPLPRIIQKAVGRRFTSDFIAARYDCKTNRGFSMATSIGAEAIAETAGVNRPQDLCLTAILLAPGDDANDTRVHMVSHFDPQVRTAVLQRAVSMAVGRTLKTFFQALHKKARSVQRSGAHPFLDCPD